MLNKGFGFLFFWLFSLCFAQMQDSVALEITINEQDKEIHVKQHFFVYNRTPKVLTNFYLHAWANAYTGRKTSLNQVKIEDRKSSLYFANKQEKGGIDGLQFSGIKSYQFKNREFVLLELEKPLAPNEKLEFKASYTVKLPHQKITQYGYDDQGNMLLKYFFLQCVPYKNQRWLLQTYKDFESVTANPTNYSLTINNPTGYFIYSDLTKNNDHWVGNNLGSFRLLISKSPKPTFYANNNTVQLGFDVDASQQNVIEQLTKKQLDFLEDRIGKPNNNQIFISKKTRKEQNFFGLDDLDAWFVRLKLFTNQEKQSLKLLQPLTYEYVDGLFVNNKRSEHWIKNGLHVYLQMRYINQYHKDLKLSGHLADSLIIFGAKPLNYFHASKLKMNDRFKLLYLFMARQNFDQPIDTPIDQMSNFNQLAISSFKTGMSFYYLSEYLGEATFDGLLRGFVTKYKGLLANQDDFRNYMILNSPKDIGWFFDDYIKNRDKINYKLLKAVDAKDSIQIKITNKTTFGGPFKIVGIKDEQVVAKQWYESNNNKNILVNFPKGEYDKLVVNPGYLFPEIDDRDNYIRTSGLFKNSKKIQFKLYNDIENPEYNQVFVLPQFRWNNYDKLQLGLTLKNSTPLVRPFRYSLSPRYSTGTGQLTGGASVAYSFLPKDEGSWFRAIQLRSSFLYEHYDFDLSFNKFSSGVSFSFNKPARSERNHGFSFSYDHLNREIAPGEIKTNEDKYNLWNATYFYTNRRIIHDIEGFVSFQTTENFSKLIAEAYYRWQILKNYRLGFRFFAGKFLQNNTDTDFFNFGVNYITDYTFSYPLLGRSETEGLLSQQFVLAEGGFKSDFDFLVDDWITSTNVEIPIWKMFDFYVDAGVYKNQGNNPRFIYDTGIRTRIIPDFLEVFLPLQSSLGFEPSLGNYHERIRFTLNLNLSKVLSYLRRGWY